jgi:glycine oxidase
VNVSIIGAGVAGLTCALELARRGVAVELFERALGPGPATCSWIAGGMLAPWCELESSEPLVAELGERSIAWWTEVYPGTVRKGTLMLAHGRDVGELARVALRTARCQRVDGDAIAALEPQLTGRFQQGLYFPDEAHLDPRAALPFLLGELQRLGGRVHFGVEPTPEQLAGRRVVDCRGLAAREALPDLRGVKGEMVLLRSREVVLQRPVRVLHPRLPVYIVPREDGVFMVGATMIESDDARRVSARSLLELLSAAYALDPALGEAEVIEVGTQVRPAFADNLPQLRRRGDTVYVNGLYRHGFLVAPALAQMVAELLLHDRVFPEVMREDPRERPVA